MLKFDLGGKENLSQHLW